jgi:hypothetical protein
MIQQLENTAAEFQPQHVVSALVALPVDSSIFVL